MDLLLQIEKIINRINDFFGRGVSWLLVLMVLNVFLVVVLRYVFSYGEVWLQETYVWMHSIVFLLGSGYTLLNNGHVRIDLVYSNASRRYKAVIDIIGTAIFAFPVLYFLFIKSFPFVERSWSIFEKSAEVGGLPGLFLFKSVLLVFSILFGLQFLALMIKSFRVFFSNTDL